jgi:transposase
MNPTIEELAAAVEQEAKKRPDALRLMTHPGVGPLGFYFQCKVSSS